MIVERRSRRALMAARETGKRLYSDALTPEEVEVLNSLMGATVEVSMVIPADAEPATVVHQLEIACKVYLFNRRSLNRLKPIIGRLLVWFEADPVRYRGLGYDSLESFIMRFLQERVGIPRSEAYDAKRLVAAFPHLTIDEFESIGPGKLRLISKISTPGQPLQRALLEKAKTMKAEDFEDYVAEKSLVTADSQTMTTLEIRCTLETRKRFKEFIQDPRVQAYCESGAEGAILDLMMSECSGEWLQHDNHDSETED